MNVKGAASVLAIMMVLIGHSILVAGLYLLSIRIPELIPFLLFAGFTYAIVICFTAFYVLIHISTS